MAEPFPRVECDCGYVFRLPASWTAFVCGKCGYVTTVAKDGADWLRGSQPVEGRVEGQIRWRNSGTSGATTRDQ